MGEEPQTSNPITPDKPAAPAASAPAASPNYIGGSNIIDRSGVKTGADIPLPAPPPALTGSPSAGDRYDTASSAFSEAKVLICGVASATSYLLIIYIVKNIWITVAVSIVLALAAIFFAVTSYGRDGRISPLSVVGISAATITLVYIANVLMAYAFVHTIVSNYNF